ncbi:MULTISPECIES: hypothetical protein [unclassified Myroides]|uniref:hypothetical protein n=1 Tax=unclassified Myroides TaxID=2642485 RepID=UPI003D2F79D7
MKEEDKGWFISLMQVFPELPGIILLLFGIVIWYWSTKGNEWMYDTGGPGVFTNITWIRNTFGEAVARRFNIIISWGIIFSGILFIAIGVWLRVAIRYGKG